jgi:hypothetical protein
MLKARHYPAVNALVPRYRGDLPGPELARRMDRALDAFTLLEFAGVSRPERPALVPSADGPIRRMLLTSPAYASQEPIMAAAYQRLLQTLPEDVGLVVLVQASAEQTVQQWLTASNRLARAEVSTFDDTLRISVWAEDGYVVAKDAATGHTYFVEPYAFPRYADGLVADFVTNFTNLRSTQAPLYFQGGNVLVGDDFFLIGADYPANTLDYIRRGVFQPPPGMTPQEFVRVLYSEYLDKGRRLLYVGSRVAVPQEQTRTVTIDGVPWTETLHAGNAPGTVQPLFHIDMFITLVGRSAPGRPYRVLVGDPSRASAILGGQTPAHAMQRVYDDIANQLALGGLEVIRNPLPLIYVDDAAARQRFWYFATSNNALVQNAPAKHVWLPTYGHGSWPELRATDDANAQIWRDLGFEVHALGDFHPFAENLGAVHCIKKYLDRG